MKIYKKIAAMLMIAASLAATNVSATLLYDYQTVINITPNSDTDNIDVIIIDWITEKNTGTLGKEDLEYLSIAFLAGGSNLYFDIPIIDGLIQDLGAAPRSPNDVFFDFDHGTGLLNQISHTPWQATTAGGTSYSLFDWAAFPVDGIAVIQKFVDGAFVASAGGLNDSNVISQSTSLLRTTSVPEPASLALLGLGLAGLGLSRKRKAA